MEEKRVVGTTETQQPEFQIGDPVKIRVHWRFKGRTGHVSGVHVHYGGKIFFDVDLDPTGSAMTAGQSVGSMEAHDLRRLKGAT